MIGLVTLSLVGESKNTVDIPLEEGLFFGGRTT